MRFLYAAVAAFFVPAVAMIGFALAIRLPLDMVFAEMGMVAIVGAMAAAPFLMMAAARRRPPGERLALAAGGLLTVLPWVVIMTDTVTAEPGRGVNIGLGVLMLFWPLIVFAIMFGLSFIRTRLDPRPDAAPPEA